MSVRPLYLVLGIHRSGTSALTQVLAAAGAGLPNHPMPGDEHNPKGYFEPWPIAIFNDERLRAAQSAWDDVFAFPYRPLPRRAERRWLNRAETMFEEEFGDAPAPVLKDPRITVLLPFWREIFEDLGRQPLCAVLLRDPLEVAASLAKRDGFTIEKSLVLWSGYMLAAEAYTQDLPRAFVAYDALLQDWRSQVVRLEQAHGRALPRLDERAARRIDRALDPKLRRSQPVGALEAFGWAGQLAATVQGELLKLCRDEPHSAGKLAWARDVLAERAREYAPLISPSAAQHDAVRQAHRDAVARLEVVRRELTEQLTQQRAAWRAELEAARRAWRAEVAERDRELKYFYEAAEEAERRIDDALTRP